MRGSDAVANALKAEGVEFVAGITGGSTFELFDSISKAGIRVLVSRHERNAVDIADGYARATGRPGVAISVNGPGAINALSGIANSYADSVPVILITGQVDDRFRYRAAYQENELMEMFHSVTGWEVTVPMPERIPEVMRRAFSAMRVPRPRPVVVAIPTNVAAADADEEALAYAPLGEGRYRFAGDPSDIDRAADLLLKAERPLVLAGAGVLASGASAELVEFADRFGVPVMTTLAGKSAIPENLPLALGIGGIPRARYNTRQAAHHAERADVVLAIGAGFRQHATSGFRAVPSSMKVIHVDVDPLEFNRQAPCAVSVLGDAGLVLKDLTDAMGNRQKSFWGGEPRLKGEIAEIKTAWREEWMPELTSDATPINPHRVVWDLMQVVDRNRCLITHDSGSPRGLICFHWECLAPRSFIAYGNQSNMGWSISSPIGMKLGNPDKDVISFLGDGSFGMAGMEMNTAARNDIKVTWVILNNEGFDLSRGQVAKMFGVPSDIPWMRLSGNIAKMAEGMGCHAERVERPEDLKGAFERALAAKEPAVVEVMSMVGATEPQ